jgi:hypothetical protein
MQEQQLTFGPYGHMLNSGQVFSPDDQWVVYDTRNDQTHIGRTCCIEKVNIATGQVKKLYASPGQTLHGPGVGGAAYHPFEKRVIFIHGLLNCNEAQPYGFTRRFGAIVNEDIPYEIEHAEARRIDEPLVPGSLRGGTHAHSWSGDGMWISFTYNDFLIEQLSGNNPKSIKDLRTIGVMAPFSLNVASETAENFSGRYFSVVAATVTDTPHPGSDEIEKAFDECWIGENGYVKKDGSRQKRAIGFQGHVRNKDGSLQTEVFVCDIPDDVTNAGEGGPLCGTSGTRPSVPRGLAQRRVTFTAERKFPGVRGPRFWMRSSPDGSTLYFLMKDDNGVVQVYEVETTGGDIRQVTRLEHSVDGQFNVSPDGKRIALISDYSVWLANIATGTTSRLTPRSDDDKKAPVGGVLWNKAGNTVVYNRYVEAGEESHLQIFKLQLN